MQNFKLKLFFSFVLFTLNINAQTIFLKPEIDKSVKKYTKINQIAIDDDCNCTLVNLNVENDNPISENDSYYWREVNTIKFVMNGEKTTMPFVLQDSETKKIYKQIKYKKSNMPRGTSSKNYELLGQQKLEFIIAFEKLDTTTKKLNLLDGGESNWNNKSGIYWHIFGIKLLTEKEKEDYLNAKIIAENQRIEEKNKIAAEWERQKAENLRIEQEKNSTAKFQIENKTFNGNHFYDYGSYKYTGSFKNGIPNGQGKWEKPDGSWYSGQFENGVENGIGTLRQTTGLRYTGNFTNGVPDGNFKIEQWTLMGLAKDQWSAIYENGKLISSSQTQTGMTDFINGKYNNSESSSNSSNSDCDTINIPTYQIQSNGLKSNGVEKYQDYTVKFDDNMNGNIMFFSSNNKWYFDTGSSFKKYSSKENAIRALYIYSKCQYITENGKL